jgi:hypothetical protein
MTTAPLPVTQEAVGSSPVAPAILIRVGMKTLHVTVVTRYSFDPVEESELVGEFKRVSVCPTSLFGLFQALSLTKQ